MGAGALFLLQPLQTASLLRAKHAIVTAAATAAIAEPPPAVLHREPARAACSSAASSPHFGLASLSRKTPGGDMRIQLLVRPNRLNLRELHAALAKLPAAEGAALGHAAEANGAAHDASAAAAPAATSGSLLAMGLKGLLEHVCSYPTTQTQRRWHFFVLAHGFSPDPVLTKVLGACSKLGVSVHFVQFDEPGAGSPLEPPADELAAAVPALIDDDEAPAAAADEGAAAVGSFAESVKAAAGASFVRMTADCEEVSDLLSATCLRHLLAPLPLLLSLQLPAAICGAGSLRLQALPRLLQLRPLLQLGMLCPCHGQPLQPAAGQAHGGWPASLDHGTCSVTGSSLQAAAAGTGTTTEAICTPDTSLLQLGSHTVLRMPPGPLAEAAKGFSRPLAPDEVVVVESEAVMPLETLDAQLLVGPAIMVVPAPADEAAAGDGGAAESAANGRVHALCAALRVRGLLLLCSCSADLDARRALPLKQWCVLQPGGRGASLLLWRLASREQLVPPSNEACAAASPDIWEAASDDFRAAATAEAEAALDGLVGSSAAAAALALPIQGGLLPVLTSGVAAWAGAILRGSSGSYVPPAAAAAAAAQPAAAAATAGNAEVGQAGSGATAPLPPSSDDAPSAAARPATRQALNRGRAAAGPASGGGGAAAGGGRQGRLRLTSV